MISLWWSFTLTALGLFGLFLVYRTQSIVGPTIGIGAQAVWIAYGIATAQWWFVASGLGYASVNVYGIMQRRRNRVSS